MLLSGKRDVALQLRGQRQQVAAAGEQAAARYLLNQGYRTICRNWRSGKFGEIDLIMQEPSGLIVFVEVKTRRLQQQESISDDRGFDAIDWRKRRKILIAAQSYLARSHQTLTPSRVDVIIVYYLASIPTEDGVRLEGIRVSHVPSAFDSV